MCEVALLFSVLLLDGFIASCSPAVDSIVLAGNRSNARCRSLISDWLSWRCGRRGC